MEYLLMEPGIITGLTCVLLGFALLLLSSGMWISYQVFRKVIEDLEEAYSAIKSVFKKESRGVEEEIEF